MIPQSAGGDGAGDSRAVIARLEAQLSAEREARRNAEDLAGSIVHKINQPLAAIATSAGACRRWIAAGPQRTNRALASLERVISESQRATAVVAGLRSLIRDPGSGIAPVGAANTIPGAPSPAKPEGDGAASRSPPPAAPTDAS
jgi:C4-dicarboxylate-specific signal transduction histidine kinase